MSFVLFHSRASWEGSRASVHSQCPQHLLGSSSWQLPRRALPFSPDKSPFSSAPLASTHPQCTPFFKLWHDSFQILSIASHIFYKRMTDFRIGEKYTPGSPPMAAQSYVCYAQNFFEVFAFYLKNSYKFCTLLHEICVLVLILKYYFKLLTSE